MTEPKDMEVNHDLWHALAIYFERVLKKDADPNYIASLIFRNLSEQGRFYRDKMGDVYLLFRHMIYSIGNNRPFNALVKKLTALLPTKEPGWSFWEFLASEAYNAGIQINLASWIHTDRSTDTVYVNPKSPNNTILKINRERVEEIQNGMSKEGVLLKSARKIPPVNFHPDADIRERMRALKELIFDKMACEREQRYLVLTTPSKFFACQSTAPGAVFSKLGTERKIPLCRTSGPLSHAVRILNGKGGLHDRPSPASALASITTTKSFPLSNKEASCFPQ